jgi:restriction endonuclease S subunit
MTDRAPDNMPTDLIHTFVDTAKRRIDDWFTRVEYNRKQLENSERALAGAYEEYETYINWLRIRNQEAAEDD